MINQTIIVTPEEKEAVEKWMSESNNSSPNAPVDILSLILYKLNLVEEKLERIEHQTKTHWADSVT